MKSRALLAALAVCLCLAACSTPEQPQSTTTAPADPNFKTVYVHTSVTQSSATVDARTEFLYDENDLLNEVIQYSGTNQTLRYQVQCDENGNFTTWSCTTDKLELTIRYSYDDQGRSLGSSHFQNGELITATTYTWEDHLRTGIHVIIPGQNQERSTQYIYNSQGILVRQSIYSDGNLSRYGICTTDDENRITSVSFYLPNGAADSVNTIVYDGLVQTHTLTLPDGTVTQTTVITHDEHGNLLSTVIYDGKGEIVSSETHTWKAIQVPIDCPRASA